MYISFLCPYYALDLGIDYRLFRNKCMLSAGVDDVFDSRGKRHVKSHYTDVVSDGIYIPQGMGRSYRVGLKFNFNTGKKVGVRNKDRSNSEEMERM